MATWLTKENYGNGSDGDLTISSNTTESPTDSSCSGAVAQKDLAATNASFAANQIILIHQSRGTGSGQWELNVIDSYTAGTITCKYDLAYTYTDSGASQAQVRVLKQYSSVTVDNSITYTAKEWNKNVGGILAFMCNGAVNITGDIDADDTGHIGGNPSTANNDISYQGEGTSGDNNTQTRDANGTGGGGGRKTDSGRGGGGGGGNGVAGSNGQENEASMKGLGGGTSGAVNLETTVFGGGGGGGCNYDKPLQGIGGDGGGLVFIFSKTFIATGHIYTKGENGTNSTDGNSGGGGGGAGGSILIKANVAVLGSNLLVATAGTGGSSTTSANGGAGGVGRIALHYGTSYTGDSNPAASFTQDNNLVPKAGGSFLYNFI